MDGNWTLPIVPTAWPADDDAITDRFIEIFPEHRTLPDKEFYIEQIRGVTTELIRRRSYCPATWTSRAYNLLRLGYPELAIGDAFKAILLWDHYNQDGALRPKVVKEVWRQTKQSVPLRSHKHRRSRDKTYRMAEYAKNMEDRAALILVQAMFKANCYIECYEFLKEYQTKMLPPSEKFDMLKELAERAQIIEDTSRINDGDYVDNSNIDLQEERRSGSILPQVYPWSAPYVQRTKEMLAAADRLMLKASDWQCYIACSNVADHVSNKDDVERQAKTLGIMADRDFLPGELILIDRAFLSGVDHHEDRCTCCRGVFPAASSSSKTYEAECCQARFCGQTCAEMSENYHFHTCSQRTNLMEHSRMMLNPTVASPDTIASNELLFRLFAHLEIQPAIHPLRSATVGVMVPAWRKNSPVRFSFVNDIKRPFAMLNILGTSIFTDHGFDTWVIQTILARVRNNVRAFEDELGHYHMALNLHYMFFNHSCEPNVKIVLQQHTSSNELFAVAARAVERRDELFINYLDDEALNLPYAERQVLLKDWTGGECQCQRCQRERTEEGTILQNTKVGTPEPDLQKFNFEYLDDFSESVYERDSESPVNRYSSKETLIENHPTVQALKRTRPMWEQPSQIPAFCDDIDTECESPSLGKRRK